MQDLSEELRTVWHMFEGVLSEAKQFVTTQTPMKAQGLQQSIEVEYFMHMYIIYYVTTQKYLY